MFQVHQNEDPREQKNISSLQAIFAQKKKLYPNKLGRPKQLPKEITDIYDS